MEFTVVHGDIASRSADALVNAAGTSLRMGSGVAGALRRGANGPINEAAVSRGPIDLGEAAVTDAYDLDADHVIHAAVMPHDGGGRATEESIREATRNALATADELGCTSVVVPVLGTGVAGVEFETGARLVREGVRRYDATSLRDVRVMAYSDADVETLERVAERGRPTGTLSGTTTDDRGPTPDPAPDPSIDPTGSVPDRAGRASRTPGNGPRPLHEYDVRNMYSPVVYSPVGISEPVRGGI